MLIGKKMRAVQIDYYTSGTGLLTQPDSRILREDGLIDNADGLIDNADYLRKDGLIDDADY